MQRLAPFLPGLIFLTLACSLFGRTPSATSPAPGVSAATPGAPKSADDLAAPPSYIPPECEGVPVATSVAVPALPAEADPALSSEQQLRVLSSLINAVRDHFIYPEAAGDAWLAKSAETQARVEAGLSTEQFYGELQALVKALGDEHSYIQSPSQVAAEAAALQGTYNVVGVGALFHPSVDQQSAFVLAVFEGGPAWHAGIQPHDTLLAVDSGPIRDSSGRSRTQGQACSAVVLRVQTPGETPRDLTVLRASVSAPIPINPGLVATSDGSKIGYLFLPTLLDKAIAETVRQALDEFGPLDGLILDNRMNSGGLGSVTEQILGHFTSGPVGEFITREDSQPLQIEADPIHNSQQVPLVVLVSEETVSYGELMSGVLRDVGRGRLVGQTTLGNLEQLRRYDFEDGSRAWLASARFVPRQTGADWEATGLVPDVEVIADWGSFTFETDPGIAAALELLGHR